MGRGSSHVGEFVLVAGGILAYTALLGWGCYRCAKSAERAGRDPRYLRRVLFRVVAFYAISILVGVWSVLDGNAPRITLLGAIVPLLIIWVVLHAASRVKVSTDSARTSDNRAEKRQDG
jgi:hypothetical protein